MNALSSLLCIALLYPATSTAPEQPAHSHCLTQTMLIASNFVPPDRGIPGRRQGGGTR